MCIYAYARVCVCVCVRACVCRMPLRPGEAYPRRRKHWPGWAWPLHDIAITNIVWCIALKGGVGGGGRILRNDRATVLQ